MKRNKQDRNGQNYLSLLLFPSLW